MFKVFIEYQVNKSKLITKGLWKIDFNNYWTIKYLNNLENRLYSIFKLFFFIYSYQILVCVIYIGTNFKTTKNYFTVTVETVKRSMNQFCQYILIIYIF